jgi:hypothetical protein
MTLACQTTLVRPATADDPDAADDEATETADTDKGPPIDPEIIRLRLMDGSVISGKLSVNDIEMETQFGKLTVPVTELRSFTPGLVNHPELGKKVYDLIDALGANDFDQREVAQKELIKLGPSVRVELEKRAGDPDAERRKRIKNILEELDSQQSDDESESANVAGTPLIQRDTLETSEFTAVGKIVTKTFTVASLYGPLTIKLGDIRRGERDSTKKTDMRKSVDVEGTYLVQRGMKVTTIRVERGDKVSVTADGSVTMTPWGNNMVSSPDGGANFGWYVPNSIPGGALVASIGSDGNIFKVGSKSTFKAKRSGVLRFGIGMQGDFANHNFPGKYNVKVRIER